MDPAPAGKRFPTTAPPRGPKTRRETFPGLPPRLRKGERLGDYTIRREIAQGSSSTVFEAEVPGGDELAAVKVLSSHLAVHADAVARFHHESALANRVEHPSLIPILGSGHQGSHHYYAMRFEAGGTLDAHCRDPLLRRDESFLADLCARFASLARAVHSLHCAGIVHRDIKPANILVDDLQRFVLIDFGSALESRQGHSSAGERVGGTIYYMSPEQLIPGADPCDPLADVYSLGITLYEAATGTGPFPNLADSELARWKLRRVPPRPRDALHGISLGLDAIIRRAIEVERSLRYRDAKSFAEDLERYGRRRRR